MSDSPEIERSSFSSEAGRAEKTRLIEGAVLRIVAWGYVAFNLGKHGIYRPLTSPGVDYYKHWFAPKAMLEGGNNYLGDWLWLGYNYPQWGAMISLWIAWFDIGTAEVIWKMIGLALIVACWFLAWRLFLPAPVGGNVRPSDPGRAIAAAINGHWGLTAAVVIVAYSPVGASSLFLGQVEPINAFLIMAMVGALLLRHERLAGVYWAMLILVKMMPAVLIVPIVLWRRWRVIQSCAFFGAVYFVVLVLTGRLEYEWFFVTEMAGEVSFYWRGISAAIPRAVMLVFFPESWHDDPIAYGRFMYVGVGILAGLYVAALVAVRRRGWSFVRSLEIAIVFVPLLSPLLENHHLAWALPVLFLQLGRWVRGEMTARVAAFLALGWSLVSTDYFIYNLMTNLGEWLRFVTMIGAVIVVTTGLAEALRGRPEKNEEASAIGFQ